MKVNQSLALSAAIAGILAGSAVSAASVEAYADAPTSIAKNGCSGPNGCGSKDGGTDKDKGSCSGKDKDKDKGSCSGKDK